MNPCNYAWNITSLGFGRNAEIDISRYIEEHENSLEIFGNNGYSEFTFNISKFTGNLILHRAGFYSPPDINTIALIRFASYSGKFIFRLFFKEG